MNHFPSNLKYLRKKRGLLQTEMQSSLGISRTTWSNYENGNTNPAVEDLVRFAKFFGISLDELIVQDLRTKEPGKVNAKKGMTKYAVYKTNDALTTTSEPDMTYVLHEIKKLREEVNTIKGKKTKQNFSQ